MYGNTVYAIFTSANGGGLLIIQSDIMVNVLIVAGYNFIGAICN